MSSRRRRRRTTSDTAVPAARRAAARGDSAPEAGPIEADAIEVQSRPLHRWLYQLALAWPLMFSAWFYSTELPNNSHISRLDVWAEVPIHLLNLIDPLPDPDGPPSGWEYLPQRFGLMLTAGLILFAAWGAGCGLLELLGLRSQLRRAERCAFAGGLGLSALSLLMLAAGLAGVLDRGLWLVALLLCGLAGLAVELRALRHQSRSISLTKAGETAAPQGVLPAGWTAAAMAAILPFGLAILLGSLLPSTDFDVKEYHLQGPKEFLQNGRISFLPHNVYTSFPFLTEMLSLLAMIVQGDWLHGALAGKLVLAAFAPLTALGLYAVASRLAGPAAGLLAAVVYASTPWVFRISTIAYAEGGLSCYLLLSLAAALRCFDAISSPDESRSAVREQRSWYLLAGLLAGSGMACKYPGLVSIVIPVGGLLLFTRWKSRETFANAAADEPTDGAMAGSTVPLPTADNTRHGRSSSRGMFRREGVVSLLLYAVGVVVAVGPWLLKNLLETGNPVYPLAWSLFGGRDWDAALNARWKAAHSPADFDVWRMLWFWTSDVTVRNDWLSPLLYGLAPLALFVRSGRRQLWWVWGYLAGLFLTWWLLTHRLDRFWVPMIPVAALLAGLGGTAVRGRAPRLVVGATLAAALLFNLTIVTSGAAGYNAFLIDLNYATAWTARHTASGIATLNSRLSRDALVLCVGEAQVFDAQFPLRYHTVFDAALFEQIAAVEPTIGGAERGQMKPVGEVHRELVARGYTHVYVNWREILRYRPTYGYPEFVQPDRFARLVRERVLRPAGPPALMSTESLSDDELAETRRWARPLVQTVEGKRLFVASQVYEVLPLP